MKKQILTLLLLIASSFSFAENNIPLIMDDPLGDLNDRSVVGVYIQASIDKGAGEFCLYEETPYRPDSVVVVSSN